MGGRPSSSQHLTRDLGAHTQKHSSQAHQLDRFFFGAVARALNVNFDLALNEIEVGNSVGHIEALSSRRLSSVRILAPKRRVYSQTIRCNK